MHRTNRLLTWYCSGSRLWLRWEHPLHPEAVWVAEIAQDKNYVEVHYSPETLVVLAAPSDRALPDTFVSKAAAPSASERCIPHALLSIVYRFLSVIFLAPRQGLLHHTGAAIFGGRMWLFPGRSGDGKSTLARLLAGHPEFEVIGDDAAVTRYGVAPPSGCSAYRAYGTPWPSSAGFAVNASAPLGGLIFLNKSLENRIEPITPREAFHRLLPATNLLWWHPEWMPVMLDGCDQLTRAVPAWQFSLAPTPAAAEQLAAWLQQEGGGG
ncbi:MAG: hypothetical protein WCO56_18610 [Verrucomicrobiota bacterium]